MQATGAAAEIEHRSAALVGERAVEAHVVAPPPVVPVVEARRRRKDHARRHGRGNVRA